MTSRKKREKLKRNLKKMKEFENSTEKRIIETSKFYTIDLAVPPEQRWVKILEDLLSKNPQLFCPLIKEINGYRTEYGKVAFSLIGYLQKKMANSYPEYYKELIGMVKITNSEKLPKDCRVSLDDLLFTNYLYSIVGGCTSAVIGNYHLRTMDWEMDGLRNLTISVEFKRNGKHLYKMTTWIGYIGCLTAMKNNKLSISLNYRKATAYPAWAIFKNFVTTMLKKEPIEVLIRKCMEKENIDYQSIVKELKETKIISPCYLIICGVKEKEHCVITRNRTSYRIIEGGEYVCQTNNDQWLDESTRTEKWVGHSFLLSTTFQRRKEAIKGLEEIKNSIKKDEMSKEELLTEIQKMGTKILSKTPVFNIQTIFSVVMSPVTNFYECKTYL